MSQRYPFPGTIPIEHKDEHFEAIKHLFKCLKSIRGFILIFREESMCELKALPLHRSLEDTAALQKASELISKRYLSVLHGRAVHASYKLKSVINNHYPSLMAETFNKKEKQKKKQQKKKEKEQRKADRKANAKSGQTLEDMMAYVDENGNISSTPPDPNKKHIIKESDIVLGSRNIEGLIVNPIRKGRVSYFNDAKGYGFIKDLKTQESIFVHASALTTTIKENDMVSFETENSVRGLNATQVKKI